MTSSQRTLAKQICESALKIIQRRETGKRTSLNQFVPAYSTHTFLILFLAPNNLIMQQEAEKYEKSIFAYHTALCFLAIC